MITKHGQETVVVIDYGRYLDLTGQGKSSLEVLRGEPPFADDLPVIRDKGDSREVFFE